jgi:hypothetical protein
MIHYNNKNVDNKEKHLLRLTNEMCIININIRKKGGFS